MTPRLLGEGGRRRLAALVAATLVAALFGCAQEDAATRAHQALLHTHPFKSWLDAANYQAGVTAFEAKDYRAAFDDWLLVAERGDGEAKLRLGRLSELGLGVPQNYIEAHRWYNLAAAAGTPGAATARDVLAARMSKEQLAEAQRLAAAWRPAGLAAPEGATSALVEGAPSEEPAPARPEAVEHFRAGLSALKAESYDSAIAEFNAGLAISRDADAFFLLGEAYRQAGESESAVKAYDDSLAADPRSAVAERARAAAATLAAQVQVTKPEAITEVQRLLKELRYYNGPADGKLNAKTAAAASAFARKENLAADGSSRLPWSWHSRRRRPRAASRRRRNYAPVPMRSRLGARRTRSRS